MKFSLKGNWLYSRRWVARTAEDLLAAREVWGVVDAYWLKPGEWERFLQMKDPGTSGSSSRLKHGPKTVLALANRDGLGCVICKSTNPAELTVDHIKPRSKGGTNELSNLRLLCRSCNSRKGAR